jgi:hypothetical protein
LFLSRDATLEKSCRQRFLKVFGLVIRYIGIGTHFWTYIDVHKMLQGKYLSVFSGKAAGVRPGSVALRDSSGSHAAFPKDELGDPFATMRRLYSRDLGKGLMSGLRSGSFGS